MTMPYERTGRSERFTKCCSSCRSAGVKQLMSVPTARRMARPDVGEPSGTLAVTITLVPRCSIWSISSARSPAPHASMAASSALLGSAPTSVSFLCRCSCCQCGGCCDDGHFVCTPPPSKLTLKVMRSMGACVGSNGTNGAPSTGQRGRRTRPPMNRGRGRQEPWPLRGCLQKRRELAELLCHLCVQNIETAPQQHADP